MKEKNKDKLSLEFHKTHSTISLIIGYAQLLKSDIDQSKLEYLEKIIESAKELSERIKQLEDEITKED